jgi:hypothetical protein
MSATRPLCALLVATSLLAAKASAEELETVELVPDERAGWTATNLFAPITGFFLGGPGYWYSPRRLEIRTTPPGAVLDLFYVRRNFQKAYEQAEAPVLVVLPSRVEASSRDSLKIRAFLDGYKQKEVSLKLRSREEELVIELVPLANQLMAVTHTYIADRASLGFLTKEALTFRMQKAKDEYSLVLIETGNTTEASAALASVQDALIASLRAQQLGQDLVVRVALTEGLRKGDVELRQRQSYDAVRRLHRLTLDVVPKGGGGSSVRRAREALARIDFPQVSGCALRFDETLREQLEPSALARALAPGGAFTDPYLRAAMKRLGEVSPDGAVVLADGTAYRTAIPLELAAAISQAGEVRGYLAMLRQFVAELEPEAYRRETLRGLVAPEVSPASFEAMVGAGERSERECLALGG